MRQFDRKCRLELIPAIGGFLGGKALIIEELRMTFEVRKNMQSKTGYNKTTVTVTNLSERHRRDIDSWGAFQGKSTALAEVRLSVKYVDAPAWSQLAKADLFRYRHSFDLPDVHTHFESDDGRLLGDTPVSVPDETVSSLAPLQDLLGNVGKQMGQAIKAPFTEYPALAKKVFTTGYNFIGKANDCLTDMLKDDADFHFTDGEPTIVPYDSVLAVGNGTGLLISEDTGLIGIPERVDDALTKSGRQAKKNAEQPATNPGWEIKTLLQPKAIPGKWLRLISKRQNIRGDYLIESVTHSGDTHGDEWFSNIRLVDNNE